MGRAAGAVAGLTAMAALAGCAVEAPTGPSVLAVPGKDKTFAQFQQDEGTCRNYAQSQVAPVTPGQAAAGNTVAGAAIGTVGGAAVGALIGAAAGNPGAGAAIGAGSGLLVGTGVGASNGAYAAGDLQRRYDFAYIQCMTANGENVQTAAAVGPSYPAYGYPSYAYEPDPVIVGGPVIGFGFGGGYWGHRYGYGGYGGRYWRH